MRIHFFILNSPVYTNEPNFSVSNFLMYQKLFLSFTHKIGEGDISTLLLENVFIIFIVFRIRNS